MSEETRNLLLKSLSELVQNGKKVSVKSVANNADLSHSVIYNRYPDLKVIIKQAQLNQAKKRQSDDDKFIIEKLEKKLNSINQIHKKTSEEQDIGIPELLSHLQQVYSMYDQILEERNEFAKELTILKRKIEK